MIDYGTKPYMVLVALIKAFHQKHMDYSCMWGFGYHGFMVWFGLRLVHVGTGGCLLSRFARNGSPSPRRTVGSNIAGGSCDCVGMPRTHKIRRRAG